MTGLAAELELRAHFDGKRDGERFQRACTVLLRGRAGSFLARTVNLSRSGALVEIDDPVFGGGLAAMAEIAGRCFGTGADLVLEEQGLRLRGRVVRILGGGLIAFRFRTPLAQAACWRLGLE